MCRGWRSPTPCSGWSSPRRACKFQAALQHPYVLIGLSGDVRAAGPLHVRALYPATAEQPANPAVRPLQPPAGRIRGRGRHHGHDLRPGLLPLHHGAALGGAYYVAQSGDLWLGGAALVCPVAGDGSAAAAARHLGGKSLPKAGAWMDVIKQLFGFALLAVPILLLSRLLSDQIATLLWLGWALVLCAYLYHHNQHRAHSLGKSLGGFVLLLAMMTLVVVGKDLLLPEPGVKASTGIQAPQIHPHQDPG